MRLSDFSPRHGYGSDTTCTVVSGTHFETREVHDVVRQAQQAVWMRCGRV
jgi:Xaa-Pro aminopeptidase